MWLLGFVPPENSVERIQNSSPQTLSDYRPAASASLSCKVESWLKRSGRCCVAPPWRFYSSPGRTNLTLGLCVFMFSCALRRGRLRRGGFILLQSAISPLDAAESYNAFVPVRLHLPVRRLVEGGGGRFLLSAEVIISTFSILIWLNPPPCFVFAHKPLQSAHLAFPVCSLTHLAHTRSASPCICPSVSVSLFALSASAVLSFFFFKVSQKKTTHVLDVSPLILFFIKTAGEQVKLRLLILLV